MPTVALEARIVKNWFHAIPIRILLPVVLTVALFVGTIFLLILPILQDRMMNDKREMIRELTETARELILAFEPGDRITYFNRAWREASGFDAAEMLAMTIFGIMPLDEKPTSQDRLDPLYSGGTAPDLFKTGLAD